MKNKNSKLLNKRFLLLLIFVFLITAILFGLQMREGATNISTYTTQRGEFITDIRSRGELEAPKRITISTPDNVHRGTRITRIISDGTDIEKGDFLVQFDTSEAENRVTDRFNELENTKTELASTQAKIESNMKQLESAYKIQLYSYEQSKLRYEMMKYEAVIKRRDEELNFKKAEIALERAKEKIESQKIINRTDLSKAEVKVKQAEMRYNEAVDQLNALTIKSPKTGLVVLQEIFNWSTRSSDKVKVGDQPRRGMLLVSIPDLTVMIAKTKVNEVDINRVEVGQKVIITLDAMLGPTFYGVVTNVATLAHRDEGTDVKVFDVEVTLDDNDKLLKPGMTAQCTIITGRIPDQLFVPLDSVFKKENTTVVYVKDGDFKQRVVKVGKKNSDYIIIENGLEEGEEVALRDPTVSLDDIGTGESIASTGLSSNGNNR